MGERREGERMRKNKGRRRNYEEKKELGGERGREKGIDGARAMEAQGGGSKEEGKKKGEGEKGEKNEDRTRQEVREGDQ